MAYGFGGMFGGNVFGKRKKTKRKPNYKGYTIYKRGKKWVRMNQASKGWVVVGGTKNKSTYASRPVSKQVAKKAMSSFLRYG